MGQFRFPQGKAAPWWRRYHERPRERNIRFHEAPRKICYIPRKKPKVTIGIGILCQHGEAILLASDNRASYGQQLSQHGDNCSKAYDVEHDHFLVISGDVGYAHEIASDFGHRMAKLKRRKLVLEEVKIRYRDARGHTLNTIIDDSLRNNLGITYDQYLNDPALAPAVRNRAFPIVESVTIEFEGIVAGFDKDRKPIFFYSSFKSAMLENVSPGYFCIGSGGPLANDFLYYRNQNVHLSVQQSLMHLAEAKIFSQIDSGVGTGTKLLLLSAKNAPIELDGHPRFRQWLDPRLDQTRSDYLGRDDERNIFANTFNFSF